MVTVMVPSPFRRFSEGKERLEVEGATLRQVFDSVGKVYPELRDHVVVDGALRPGLAIAIDDFYTEGDLTERVPEGGTVHILPAMSGGVAAKSARGRPCDTVKSQEWRGWLRLRPESTPR